MSYPFNPEQIVVDSNENNWTVCTVNSDGMVIKHEQGYEKIVLLCEYDQYRLALVQPDKNIVYSKLPKEIKQNLIKQLSYPFGQVELECDGYRISLQVKQKSPLKFVIMTYINGKFVHEWMRPDKNHPESKYLRQHNYPAYTPKQRANAVKLLGKKNAEKQGFHKKLFIYDPTFLSPTSAINHICKVSQAIKVLQVGYA